MLKNLRLGLIWILLLLDTGGVCWASVTQNVAATIAAIALSFPLGFLLGWYSHD